ncbi:MAG: hypothetical protein Q9220_002155 [cf. Caloplaca sp. 1 TL-2023]
MGVTFSQFFPPPPTLTEANLPSQKGKVFIVTGGYSGIGFELCQILYQAGGKIYLAGRSEAKTQAAIEEIQALHTISHGKLVFLPLALDDLSTIKPAVNIFTSSETRLDVLFNNAGVSNPPRGSVSAQGHELQLATNCLGHHLLTQLLLPTLRHTAQITSSAAVRVVWTSSFIVDLAAPRSGIEISELAKPPPDQQRLYVNSKLGNWYLAAALAEQVGPEGPLSVTQNPGNLQTALLRHMPWILGYVIAPLLYQPRMGAYTELWAGLSNDLKMEDAGKYILPWGRLHPAPRPELLAAMKTKAEDGTGNSKEFMEYCDKCIVDYI